MPRINDYTMALLECTAKLIYLLKTCNDFNSSVAAAARCCFIFCSLTVLSLLRVFSSGFPWTVLCMRLCLAPARGVIHLSGCINKLYFVIKLPEYHLLATRHSVWFVLRGHKCRACICWRNCSAWKWLCVCQWVSSGCANRFFLNHAHNDFLLTPLQHTAHILWKRRLFSVG